MNRLNLFLLFLSINVFISLAQNETKTYLAIGDAGSTGTRVFIYQKQDSSYISICQRKDKFRLGEAIIDNKAEEYAINMKKLLLDAFKENCNITSAEPQVRLAIYSTAGSRINLNILEEKKQYNFTSFTNAFFEKLKSLGGIKYETPIILNVISGRMEGVLGLFSLEKSIPVIEQMITRNILSNTLNLEEYKSSKVIYYEAGGASSQIVWPLPDKIQTIQRRVLGYLFYFF